MRSVQQCTTSPPVDKMNCRHDKVQCMNKDDSSSFPKHHRSLLPTAALGIALLATGAVLVAISVTQDPVPLSSQTGSTRALPTPPTPHSPSVESPTPTPEAPTTNAQGPTDPSHLKTQPPASEKPSTQPAVPQPASPQPAADVTPPVILVGTLPAVVNGFEGCVASGFTVTATDASGVASVSVVDDHPAVNVGQYWRESDRFGFSATGLSPQPSQAWTTAPQKVTVVITATDTVGNKSSVTRTFNYYDWVSYCADAT